MIKAGDDSVKLHPSGHVSYQEKRVVRFCYCVLGWEPLRIAYHVNRSTHFISNLINRENLRAVRANIDARIIKKVMTGVENSIEEVHSLTVAAIKKGLMDIIRSEAPITVKELKLLSDITANYDRIIKVNRGKPTAITKTVHEFSEIEATKEFVLLLQRMKQDPMFDMAKFIKEVGVDPAIIQQLEAMEVPVSEDDFN